MAVGRTQESRTVASVVRTNTSTAITAPAGSFVPGEDVGRTITGTGIPAAATLAAVASATAATLSAAATSTTTGTVTLGASTGGLTTGYIGWSPETDAENGTYTVAANNAGTPTPDRISNTYTSAQAQRARQ